MSRRFLLFFAIAIGVAARVFFASAFRGNYDQQSYELVVAIIRRGGNVYAETSRYNYSPLWAYCLLAFDWLASATTIPFHIMLRLFLIAVDVVNSLLIGALYARFRSRPRVEGIALYLLNPVAILVVGFQGQFETLALFPLLVATWFSTQLPTHRRNMWLWALGTIALLIKHITLFPVWMLFVFMARRRAPLLMIGALAVFAVSFLPFISTGYEGIYDNVLRYQSRPGVYGFGVLFPMPLAGGLLYGVMAILPFIAVEYLRLSQAKSMELCTVAFVALVYGIGGQYFLLPVVFGSIFLSRWYVIYTAFATLCLVSGVDGFFQTFPVLWNTVWIVSIGWFVSFFVVWKMPVSRRTQLFAPFQQVGDKPE
jgi:hypothetical protein